MWTHYWKLHVNGFQIEGRKKEWPRKIFPSHHSPFTTIRNITPRAFTHSVPPPQCVCMSSSNWYGPQWVKTSLLLCIELFDYICDFLGDLFAVHWYVYCCNFFLMWYVYIYKIGCNMIFIHCKTEPITNFVQTHKHKCNN